MPKKILLIEDQLTIVKMLTARLKASGYQVISATDGQMGIDKVNAEMPDLVITDLAIPKINGSVIVRILKMSEKHKNIPVIVLSAFVHSQTGEHVEVPADAYIPKPFDSEMLIMKIKELIKE